MATGMEAGICYLCCARSAGDAISARFPNQANQNSASGCAAKVGSLPVVLHSTAPPVHTSCCIGCDPKITQESAPDSREDLNHHVGPVICNNNQSTLELPLLHRNRARPTCCMSCPPVALLHLPHYAPVKSTPGTRQPAAAQKCNPLQLAALVAGIAGRRPFTSHLTQPWAMCAIPCPTPTCCTLPAPGSFERNGTLPYSHIPVSWLKGARPHLNHSNPRLTRTGCDTIKVKRRTM